MRRIPSCVADVVESRFAREALLGCVSPEPGRSLADTAAPTLGAGMKPLTPELQHAVEALGSEALEAIGKRPE